MGEAKNDVQIPPDNGRTLSLPVTLVIMPCFLCCKGIPWIDVALSVFSYFLYSLAVPHGLQDLSSLTRDRTCAPCSGSAES